MSDQFLTSSSLFNAVIFMAILYLLTAAIKVAIIISNDAKVWSKLDRIVIFFKEERDKLNATINDLSCKIEGLNKEIKLINDKTNSLNNIDNNK